MAILTGPLMSVNDTGKVPNRKVAKSQIVLLILITNVGRSLIETFRLTFTANG